MQAPVSAVIPCYNCSETIEKAVDSIAKQTLIPQEVILVNDDSSDHTIDILQNLQNNYGKEWIKIIDLKQNVGPGQARNLGWESADQDYLAFLDADDIWLPEKLEKQIVEIKKEKIDFIGCNRNQEVYPFFKKNNKKLFCLSAKDLLFKWYPHTSTALVKKSILLQAGL
jgi:glycosyltransferase involved in cell wall biosynthesis